MFLLTASKAGATTIKYSLAVRKIHLYRKNMHMLRNNSDHTEITKSRKAIQKSKAVHIVVQEGVFGLYRRLETHLGSAVLKEPFLNMSSHEINRIRPFLCFAEIKIEVI
uniref:Uncharacterized protein n=1 Tax=Aplanochytrium stocchinoi TaxID=215587 RepID=A0A7S3PSW3_9STRA|mmetsp:Transcript_1375/g.1845  ORF Transcript_1375/g.1845 Transcript_1375/m.1845 type:complete len:109 (+) Transcript_1375:169-495(+)